jgi:hypothetical protein
MLRKSITFNNFDGKTVTEEHFFHMTKAELIKLEVGKKGGGLQEHLQRVVAGGEPSEILAAFEMIVQASYGVRTENGGFIKRPEDWNAFLSSEAYSTMFMELVTDASVAAQFIKGIMPSDIDAAEIDKAMEDLQVNKEEFAAIVAGPTTEDVELPQPEQPAWIREDRDPSPAEIQRMSKDELVAAMQRKNNRKREGV